MSVKLGRSVFPAAQTLQRGRVTERAHPGNVTKLAAARRDARGFLVVNKNMTETRRSAKGRSTASGQCKSLNGDTRRENLRSPGTAGRRHVVIERLDPFTVQ